MVNKRHPWICRFILRSIVTDNPPHHIEGVTISEAALRLSRFHLPSWEDGSDKFGGCQCWWTCVFCLVGWFSHAIVSLVLVM